MIDDKAMLDFIENNDAMLTRASDFEGTEKEWRCYVCERRYPTPDRRERSGRVGWGKTARSAVVDAITNGYLNDLVFSEQRILQ